MIRRSWHHRLSYRWRRWHHAYHRGDWLLARMQWWQFIEKDRQRHPALYAEVSAYY